MIPGSHPGSRPCGRNGAAPHEPALGLTRDDEGPRLNYSTMRMTEGQRRGMIREFKDALGRELMAADADFIRRAKRGIVNG